ncbi:aliphatic sulfonate ABC transporter substrate-binding protein [Cohnella herbarum]|uniref:Putative aliphatic sulfonates-binding protein n=1 Tax=Cohnella herbarum TaxID=2728023 RepID=A0A7Z2ZKD2_9BACL|nr:aliphatic sulfonate ABC transporter substrate-binding protein [Cohnella herbarum]QJD82853.1 aliphatic sulfonate ABC transporter substrate-binding protein [Cohnella herbarum]
MRLGKGKQLAFVIVMILVVLQLAGCGNGTSKEASSSVTKIKLDYAYYNPVSLVLKEKGFLEEALKSDGTEVEWVLSAGSNKALEYLNSKSIDFGSTAGAAALLGKSNGNPIKSIYVYSKPEWTALVTKADSTIAKAEDLKGKKIAVTRGTDPHIFLLRILDQAGLTEKDVELVQLQHADGKAALEKGEVDAWAGLDPFMAQTEVEQGSKLVIRDASLNTYGVLNVRESFASDNPELTKKVIEAYEKARNWAIDNGDEFKKIVSEQSKQTLPVVDKVIERTDLSDPVIGDKQKEALNAAGVVLLKSGIIPEDTDVAKVVDELIDSQYFTKIAQ